MKQTLYKFGSAEIARDEDEYYLIKDGRVEEHGKEWRMIVTSFFGFAEMKVLNIIGRYEKERKETNERADKA